MSTVPESGKSGVERRHRLNERGQAHLLNEVARLREQVRFWRFTACAAWLLWVVVILAELTR